MSTKEQGSLTKIVDIYMNASLIFLIAMGLVIGIVLGIAIPSAAGSLEVLANLFVGALKSIAPLLVFILVCAAIAGHKRGDETQIKTVIIFYLLGTFIASSLAVIASFIFPSILLLQDVSGISANANAGSVESVLLNLISQIVANPINALITGNYICLIFWAVLFGIGFQNASESSKQFMADLSKAISAAVRVIVRFAPFGVMSLVYSSVATFGIASMYSYIQLLFVLIGTMLFVAFVVNPLMVYVKLRQNPYPLIWLCIKNSALTAFFTRSSAANIPMNMDLCRRLNLQKETYAISIPLGATINMAGAAITVTILTLAAANTLGMQVDFISAIILSLVASICACGASGIAGGSLMLIPLACSLLGINNDIALQVVGIGFVISVLQDSFETALNSSTDVVFTTCSVLDKRDNLAIRVREAEDNI